MEEGLARYLAHLLPSAEAVRVSHLVRIPGGASRETWMFKAVWQAAGARQSREFVVRKDPPAGLIASSRVAELAFYRGLAGSGVPLPVVVAAEEDPRYCGAPFLLMERMAGIHSDFHVLLSPEWDDRRSGIARQMYEILGQVHAFDWRGTPIAAVDEAPEPGDCWERELARWQEALAANALEPMPIARAAIRWLRRNRPAPAQRVAVVHGDYRVGNVFFHPDGTVRAVVDWELAHLGDPLEDLAWSFMEDWEWSRDGRKGGIVSAEDAIAVYEQAGGGRVDRESLRWWGVLCGVKAQALWAAAARAYTAGGSREITLTALAYTLANSEDEHLLRSLGRDA